MTTDSDLRRTNDPNVRYYHVTSDGSSSTQLKSSRISKEPRRRSKSFWVLLAVVALIIIMVIVLIVMASLEGQAADSALLRSAPAAVASSLALG